MRYGNRLAAPGLFRLYAQRILIVFAQRFARTFSCNFAVINLVILQILILENQTIPKNLHILPYHAANGRTGNHIVSVGAAEEIRIFLSVRHENRRFCGKRQMNLTGEQFCTKFIMRRQFAYIGIPHKRLTLGKRHKVIWCTNGVFQCFRRIVVIVLRHSSFPPIVQADGAHTGLTVFIKCQVFAHADFTAEITLQACIVLFDVWGVRSERHLAGF